MIEMLTEQEVRIRNLIERTAWDLIERELADSRECTDEDGLPDSRVALTVVGALSSIVEFRQTLMDELDEAIYGSPIDDEEDDVEYEDWDDDEEIELPFDNVYERNPRYKN